MRHHRHHHYLVYPKKFCKSSSVNGLGLVDFRLPLEDAISETKNKKVIVILE